MRFEQAMQMVEKNDSWRLYSEMLKKDGRDNIPGAFYQYEQIFGNVDFTNKTVLDIGSGKGRTAIYAALRGARKVLSMEPELDGSSSKVIETQLNRINELKLQAVHLVTNDFNAWDSGGEKFDIIMSMASINHLYEVPFNASSHPETNLRYTEITTKIHSLLNPGGIAVITDACRYGFFFFSKHIGLHRPWNWNKKASIDWRVHQNPGVWRELFLQGGFQRVDISYPTPFPLKPFSMVINNPIANFFLNAAFILHCHA